MRKIMLEVTLGDPYQPDVVFHAGNVDVWTNTTFIDSGETSEITLYRDTNGWLYNGRSYCPLNIRPVMVDTEENTDPRAVELNVKGYHGL